MEQSNLYASNLEHEWSTHRLSTKKQLNNAETVKRQRFVTESKRDKKMDMGKLLPNSKRVIFYMRVIVAMRFYI